MFLTRNKKDYTRHLKSRKHLENHPTAPPPDATADTTLHCAKCNKEFKSRSAMYTHNKKCGSAAGAEEEATEEAAEASEAAKAARWPAAAAHPTRLQEPARARRPRGTRGRPGRR